jgi:hypothetical protein
MAQVSLTATLAMGKETATPADVTTEAVSASWYRQLPAVAASQSEKFVAVPQPAGVGVGKVTAAEFEPAPLVSVPNAITVRAYALPVISFAEPVTPGAPVWSAMYSVAGPVYGVALRADWYIFERRKFVFEADMGQVSGRGRGSVA